MRIEAVVTASAGVDHALVDERLRRWAGPRGHQVVVTPAPADGASDEVMRAASVLGRARTLPAQPVPRPGRFAGEFGTRP